jgi:hypothetical protein
VLKQGLVLIGVLSFLMISGCSNVKPELSKPPEVVTWPALQALQSPDINMGIVRSAQMKDFKSLKANLADAKLEEAVKKFEDEPIPSKFASPAREEAKKNVVKEYKYLISSSKGMASNNDLKSGVDALQQSIAKLTDPSLK